MANIPPNPASPPEPDFEAVKSSLKFLWDQRRLHQFILRGIRQKINALDAQEKRTRNQIGMFTRRIDRELDMYPKQAREAGFVRHVIEEDDDNGF